MQTQSRTPAISPTKEKVAAIFRLVGWIAFWVELGLAVASGFVWLVAISGRNFATETNPGIGIGIFWAFCGILAVLFSAFLAFRYTRIARGLQNSTAEPHPKKADTVKLLRIGVIAGLAGILLCLLGAGTTLGVLVAKTISQPPGVAITAPNKIVRTLDVFVAVANINGIAGNFVGLLTSWGLLNWLDSE